MSNPNQHIVDELNRFRESAEVFYAIQIDAPWGSGKTHFINRYIKDHCPKDTEDAPRNLIISLFGVKSVEEIEQQIISQLFSGGQRFLGFIVSTAALGVSGWFKTDKATGQVLDESRAKILAERLKEVKNGIIVFDDLERCSMKLVDALGYINRFIEKEKYKVILISNEQAFKRPGALKEEQENSILLTSFKEKLVGRTLHLKADPDEAYDAFANDLKDIKAKKSAQNAKARALTVFRASKRENLRSLRIGLEAFDRLSASFDPAIVVTDEGLQDVLIGCIYVACEIGAAVKHDLVSQPTAGRLSRLMRNMGGASVKEPSEDEITLNNLINKYGDVMDLRSPTINFELLVDFVGSGLLRKTEIEYALSTSPLMVGASKAPLWRRLIEVWHLSSDRMRDDTNELIGKFAKFEILDPGDLLHLAGIILWRESYGDYTITAGVHPEKFIEMYLSSLKRVGKALEVNLKLLGIDRLSAYGYQVLGADQFHERLLRIYSLIENAIDEAASQKFPEVYKALCAALMSADRDMEKILGDDFSPYLRMPVLKVADVREFADVVMRDKKFDAGILIWLTKRYDNFVSPLVKTEEQSWLDNLYVELRDRIICLDPPLNNWWMKILDQNLQHLITPPSPAVPSPAPAPGPEGDEPN